MKLPIILLFFLFKKYDIYKKLLLNEIFTLTFEVRINLSVLKVVPRYQGNESRKALCREEEIDILCILCVKIYIYNIIIYTVCTPW